MQSWEDFLWIYKQPEVIALLLFLMVLHPLLKYLRRFYPKSLQKIANDSEVFTAELAKNQTDSKLMKQSHFYESMLIFIPALLIFTLYLTDSYINGTVLSPYFIKESFTSIFAPIMFISLGTVSIKSEEILKFKLKDDYQRYLKLKNKANMIDPYAQFFEKNKNFFGYMIIAFGLFVSVAPFIFE